MTHAPPSHAPPFPTLQAASQGNDRALFKAYSDMSTRLSRQIHLRGLLRFKHTAQSIPLDQVSSFGAISICFGCVRSKHTAQSVPLDQVSSRAISHKS